MDYNTLLELVKKRRSIRRFKPDPIPDKYIDNIIEVARWAPSGFNSQPWEFVVVRKPELKSRIVQIINEANQEQPRMEATRESWQRTISPLSQDAPMDFSVAPVFILLFGDTRTKDGLPMAVRYDYLRCQSIFHSSLASVFLYMHLAATTLGLASQWVWPKNPLAHCLVKELLGVPKEMEIYDMMVLGYPAVKPRPKLMRDKAKMLHYDYCGEQDFRRDEEVKYFIRRTRAWVIATTKRAANEL